MNPFEYMFLMSSLPVLLYSNNGPCACTVHSLLRHSGCIRFRAHTPCTIVVETRSLVLGKIVVCTHHRTDLRHVTIDYRQNRKPLKLTMGRHGPHSSVPHRPPGIEKANLARPTCRPKLPLSAPHFLVDNGKLWSPSGKLLDIVRSFSSHILASEHIDP